MKKLLVVLGIVSTGISSNAASILIPMDETQTDHLKAYGIAWNVLDHKGAVKWLLNYRGGAYLFEYNKEDEQRCLESNVKFETLPDVMASSVLEEVNSGKSNTAAVDMQRAPNIAVYAPGVKEVWDDPVSMVLDYAGIPYDVIYDKDVLTTGLSKYDWLHLHHEDFTGQHNRFYAGFSRAQWFRDEVSRDSACAAQMGYAGVQELKLAVALKMKAFINSGGFLFAMCTATDSYDIALAAEGVDICAAAIDGDPMDANPDSKLNYSNCLAFENFKLKLSANEFEFSDIDTYETRVAKGITQANDYFFLNTFSAVTQKEECMLVQNHVSKIKGFWGTTTGYDLQLIKKNVSILAQTPMANEARYISGTYGKGTWTFYSGHDPEDYQHHVGEPATDLSKFPNSPGYRLILNNVLFQSTRTQDETHALFSAFPNPAVTNMHINFSLPEGRNGQLTIYNADGKIVSSEELSAGSTEITIDVSALASGNYTWDVACGQERLHAENFSVVH